MARSGDRRRGRGDWEGTEAVRTAMQWTRQRLDILEVMVLLLALVLALLGGGLVAWVLHNAMAAPFRLSWAVVSLLLFIVPGGGVYLRELRRARKKGTTDVTSEPKDLNG